MDGCCQDVLDANDIPFVRAPADASFEFLVTTPNDSVFRVASAAGWVTEGRVRFNPSDDYSEDVVDLILVYCEETGSVYLVESSEFETSISLRVKDPERDRADVKLADEYEFTNRWDEVVSG